MEGATRIDAPSMYEQGQGKLNLLASRVCAAAESSCSRCLTVWRWTDRHRQLGGPHISLRGDAEGLPHHSRFAMLSISPHSDVYTWTDQLLQMLCAHGFLAAQDILLSYQPRASVEPAALDLTMDPFMWPFHKQPLYAGAMPAMFNATVLNGMSLTGDRA